MDLYFIWKNLWYTKDFLTTVKLYVPVNLRPLSIELYVVKAFFHKHLVYKRIRPLSSYFLNQLRDT